MENRPMEQNYNSEEELVLTPDDIARFTVIQKRVDRESDPTRRQEIWDRELRPGGRFEDETNFTLLGLKANLWRESHQSN